VVRLLRYLTIEGKKLSPATAFDIRTTHPVGVAESTATEMPLGASMNVSPGVHTAPSSPVGSPVGSMMCVWMPHAGLVSWMTTPSRGSLTS